MENAEGQVNPLARYGLKAQLPESLDHQVTGMFGECERMAYYVHILGRRRTSEDKTALNWGKCMHSAKEVWELTHDTDQVVAVIDAQLAENIEDRYGRTKGRMFEAFLKYAEFQATNPLKVLRTEQSVLVQCEPGNPNCPLFPGVGCDLTYGGRLDNVVEWQGMVGPLDLKTTVMDDQDPIAEYRPSHQFMGYVWAITHLMGEFAWGIIVDRIVTNKSKINISRFPVSFNRDNIRDWVLNEKEIHARLTHLATNHPYDESKWIQNYFRCQKPWPCSFRDACLSPSTGGFRYKWLATNTEEHRWDFKNPDAEPNT